MADLPRGRTELAFDDYKPAWDGQHAVAEANRCLYCYDAPCVKACPTGIDIPGFIRKIATGNLEGSARTIAASNVFGASCARVCPVEVLCVGDCVYNALDQPPIQIGRLQRYASESAIRAGTRFFEAGADTGRSVGLVGAGPASLACAHRLRRFGHRTTIYERRDVVGGLNTYGVAPYKLPAEDSLDEIAQVMAIGGIEVKTGISVPDDASWDDLLARHDALFLGFGLGEDSRIPGPEPAGVAGAVEWIEAMKLGTVDLSRVRRAVVIGGGNTAMDCLRELCGLGVPDVAMIYRGTEESMTGYVHEWEAARKLGARPLWQTQPVGYESRDGEVSGVHCVRVDAQKQPIADSAHTVAADLVLLAIGQTRLSRLLHGLPGVMAERGTIIVDDEGRTGNPRVFAGGDAANGAKEVVNAVAEGRDAAVAIHRLLGGA